MTRVTFVAVMVLLATPIARAEDKGKEYAGRCAPYDLPIDLVFTVVTPEPELHTTVTAEEIEAIARGQKIEDDEHHPSGVTVSETLLSLDSTAFAVHSRSVREDGECIYLDRVKATFGWRAHNMYVASGIRPGQCVYAAVLEHEKEHAAINTEVLLEFAPRIKAVLEATLAREVPTYQRRPGSAVRDAVERIDKGMDEVLAAFQKEKARRNAVIDTHERRLTTTLRCSAPVRARRPRLHNYRDAGSAVDMLR